MKYNKERRCNYSDELLAHDLSSQRFNTYLKQIRFQQKELARKIFEMVKEFTEEDILWLRNKEFETNHHCKHCNRVLPPDSDPVSINTAETQTLPDQGAGKRRRRKHH